MSDSTGEEAVVGLERLETVVKQRTDNEVWHSFLVAQASSREHTRRREMTTQKILLIDRHEP